jgi:hypothetical protein
MRQQTLAMQSGFEKFARKSRRECFLDEMDKIVPWGGLVALVEPYYPKGESGRPPVGLERMLRLYFLQQWFNLSDPGLEDALYESAALRRFAGIDLPPYGRRPVRGDPGWAVSRCRTRRRSATFATFLRSTILAGRC